VACLPINCPSFDQEVAARVGRGVSGFGWPLRDVSLRRVTRSSARHRQSRTALLSAVCARQLRMTDDAIATANRNDQIVERTKVSPEGGPW